MRVTRSCRVIYPLRALSTGAIVLIVCAACAQPALDDPAARAAEQRQGPPEVSNLSEIEKLFVVELARLGINPAKVTAAAPAEGSDVFDLQASAADGITLTWTERLRGDYDQNGRTNISDLTSLAHYLGRLVTYDDPSLHFGFSYWPSGNPLDDGGAPLTDSPPEGSGARNWHLARIDGDGNGQVNINDLTPLGNALGQQITGYRVYKRSAADAEWVLLGDPTNPEAPHTVAHLSPQRERPLAYSFNDPAGTPETMYLVRPFDSISGQEGSSSPAVTAASGIAGSAPTAVLLAEPRSGQVPLAVVFDSASSSDVDGTIVSYELDFEGDGEFDVIQSTPISGLPHIYTQLGQYPARLRVTDNLGLSAVATEVISVGDLPEVALAATPDNGESPIQVELDASASKDPGGDVLVFDWDLDGDGSYEFSTGLNSSLVHDFAATSAIEVGVKATSLSGLSAVQRIVLNLRDEYDEVEPNDSWEFASAIGPASAAAGETPFTGSLGLPGYDGDGTDWLSFTVEAGTLVNIAAAFDSSAADLNIRLLSTDGETFLANGTQSGNLELISQPVVVPGTLYLRVQFANPSNAQPVDYTIDVVSSPLPLNDTEPNDTLQTAQPFSFQGLPEGQLAPGVFDFYGYMDSADKADWLTWQFPTQQTGYRLKITLRFAHSAADLDLETWWFDQFPSEYVPFAWAYGVLDVESIDEDAPYHDPQQLETYYLRVIHHTGGAGHYHLHIQVI